MRTLLTVRLAQFLVLALIALLMAANAQADAVDELCWAFEQVDGSLCPWRCDWCD